MKFFCSFPTQTSSYLSIINYFQDRKYSQLLIHLHLISNDEEKQSLPSNILILPLKDSLNCFCYKNLFFSKKLSSLFF
jgi:hypothetical protein